MLTLTVVALLSVAIYLFLIRNFDYWKKRGVKHDKPIPLFGNNKKTYLMQVHFTEVIKETYKKYPNEQLVGFFRGSHPALIIRDPELTKRVLSSDFNYFHRRGVVKPEAMEPMLRNQLTGEDDLWRQLRLRMTPVFSSGKLKAMFPLIVQRAEMLQTTLNAIVAEEKAVDARDLMARFTNDVIGTIGFGIASDSLNNPNDPMRQLGIQIFNWDVKRLLSLFLKMLSPKIFGHLKVHGKIEGQIIEMVQSVMQRRNYEPSGRHDFIDLLLEAKKKGTMTGESMVEFNADGTPKKVSIEMDDELMASQGFLFFAAGFETSSSVSSYTLHELAHNPEVQLKVQKEIDSVLARHDNKLSYDAISEMTYLLWALDEATRILPPIGVLLRQSVQPYTFSGTEVSIDAGLSIIIPLAAYQNDPKIFPEPEKFRPERFDPEQMTSLQKMAYLPFGGGPRACVGERLGLMQAMAGLAAVLSKFTVLPAPGAPRHPVISPFSGGVTLIKGGLPLIFQMRTDH